MSELKPCPFCGSDGKVSCRNFMSSIEDLELDDVMCEKCGIYFETYTRDDVDAVTLWNHRPIEDAKDREIERLCGLLKLSYHEFVQIADWCLENNMERDGQAYYNLANGILEEIQKC